MVHNFNLRFFVSQEIDRLAPDRYDTGDDSWMDPIANSIKSSFETPDEIQRNAKRYVKEIETEKVRSGLKLLREANGKPPLDWEAFFALPIVVGGEKARIRACDANDLRLFAQEERRRNAREFVVRNESCESAEYWADELEKGGYRTMSELKL